MGKKILYIVLGALVVFGILFLLWTWFFSGSGKPNGGALGNAGDTTGLPNAGSNDNNGQTNLGNNGTQGAGSYDAQGNYVGAGNGTYDSDGTFVGVINGSTGTGSGTTGTNGNGVGIARGTGAGSYDAGGNNVGIGNGTYDVNGNFVGTITNNGTLGGGGTGGGGTVGGIGGTGSTSTADLGGGGTIGTTFGSSTSATGVYWLGSPFNPTDINSISTDAGASVPTITSQSGSSGGTSLIAVLAGTVVAGTLSCAIQAGLANGIGITTTSAIIAAPIGTSPGFNLVGDAGLRAAAVGQTVRNTTKDNITFAGCIVNVIAKTLLATITTSVVNWINSGFKGQPSFIQNFQQFFTNVADLAAGEFIKGAGLSFLCSPFQLQIKIAIAQSYANRNAMSCSLTKVITNINSFMKGNFSQGGWGGFVSFTTMPTNNPYGAFAYAQAGLTGAQNNAQNNANKVITPGGFIALQQQTCGGTVTISPLVGQNAQAALAGGTTSGCKSSVTTPGTVIQDSLKKVTTAPIDQLGLANSLDQIINALMQQLMVKILQNGLTSLSQSTTQTAADLAAQSTAQTLLNTMQTASTQAQQLGAIAQGSIADIQSAQASLIDLANCWDAVASAGGSTNASSSKATALAQMNTLEAQITAYNNNITVINSSIATINQYESEIAAATTAAEVTSISSSYSAAAAAGSFATQADITTAQQNRATLQSQLATINQTTQTGLTQCNAAGGN